MFCCGTCCLSHPPALELFKAPLITLVIVLINKCAQAPGSSPNALHHWEMLQGQLVGQTAEQSRGEEGAGESLRKATALAHGLRPCNTDISPKTLPLSFWVDKQYASLPLLLSLLPRSGASLLPFVGHSHHHAYGHALAAWCCSFQMHKGPRGKCHSWDQAPVQPCGDV